MRGPPRWLLHLHVQRESTAANHPEIKSQGYWFEFNRGSKAPGERSVRPFPAIDCREDASQTIIYDRAAYLSLLRSEG
jgi:hypothetical protein